MTGFYEYDLEDAYGESYKNPAHVERLLDRADDDRKRARENGVPNPLVEEWKADERAAAVIFGRCESMFNHGLRCIRAAGHDGGCYYSCSED